MQSKPHISHSFRNDIIPIRFWKSNFYAYLLAACQHWIFGTISGSPTGLLPIIVSRLCPLAQIQYRLLSCHPCSNCLVDSLCMPCQVLSLTVSCLLAWYTPSIHLSVYTSLTFLYTCFSFCQFVRILRTYIPGICILPFSFSACICLFSIPLCLLCIFGHSVRM